MTALATASRPGHLLADAVRYRLLMRMLPVVRHEILGPLSVARMALTILQRGVQGPNPDSALLRSRVADVKQHLAATTAAVSDLRVLDRHASDGHPEDRRAQFWHAVVVSLAQLGGHRIEWDDGTDAGIAAAPGAAWELLATAVAHAVDDASGVCALHVRAHDASLIIRRRSISDAGVDHTAFGIVPAHRIDADDVRHLADDGGSVCSIIAGDPWELRLTFDATPTEGRDPGAPLHAAP